MKANTYYESFKLKEPTFYMEAALDHFNERIRVDLYRGSVRDTIEKTEELARHYQYTKLIIKARGEHVQQFLHAGYTMEAIVDGYFQGSHMLFMVKYSDQNRRNSNYWSQGEHIVASVRNSTPKEKNVPIDYSSRKATVADAKQLAALYGTVFQIYPTPLNEASYVAQTMQEGTIYRVYEKDGVIVSAASAEIDVLQKNAELTNCATLEEDRQYGLMKELLKQLECDLQDESIYCAYTIARSLSYGMNAAFWKLGYQYRGRLVNNCYIFDKLEDMNVWVKDISKA
ncbi:putative beta-lysine N-acetyltransferase [Ectobacillus antri]|jgi:putative beta-lysine N-acetyltransferase|uniref:Beta-lysine N-acetyltransferase n=1 Tax=Ectobacillus antri TaxID=2486280 RepID=A0ABT6H6J9_9BACI|nr:putative beta-lysine N-acetyltransferase [Ectobacillus antri]MDG4656974.1 putative beta-lysine N-acetyltransferase [Ectobacillus antri]MDG5754076.1 putative beta-lysine N-acetyltransferase [Ectobacillus antri]